MCLFTKHIPIDLSEGCEELAGVYIHSWNIIRFFIFTDHMRLPSIDPGCDTHHTIPKHIEIFLILGVLKMSAAVYFFSKALSWTDSSRPCKIVEQKNKHTARLFEWLTLKCSPHASGVMESISFAFLFVSAHFFKYLCASSVLPLAKSQRADSGIHLEGEARSAKASQRHRFEIFLMIRCVMYNSNTATQ